MDGAYLLTGINSPEPALATDVRGIGNLNQGPGSIPGHTFNFYGTIK